MGPSGRFTHVMIYWTVWDRFIQVLYLGRAPRTKETLPDFLKWRRVTRHPLVFRGLTGSQRTLGFWGVTVLILESRIGSAHQSGYNSIYNHAYWNSHHH